MAILIKKFSKVGKFLKTPQGIVSASALGVSGANFATNLSRHRRDREYQVERLRAMNRLTGALGKVNNTMEKNIVIPEDRPLGFLGFRSRTTK